MLSYIEEEEALLKLNVGNEIYYLLLGGKDSSVTHSPNAPSLIDSDKQPYDTSTHTKDYNSALLKIISLTSNPIRDCVELNLLVFDTPLQEVYEDIQTLYSIFILYLLYLKPHVQHSKVVTREELETLDLDLSLYLNNSQPMIALSNTKRVIRGRENFKIEEYTPLISSTASVKSQIKDLTNLNTYYLKYSVEDNLLYPTSGSSRLIPKLHYFSLDKLNKLKLIMNHYVAMGLQVEYLSFTNYMFAIKLCNFFKCSISIGLKNCDSLRELYAMYSLTTTKSPAIKKLLHATDISDVSGLHDIRILRDMERSCMDSAYSDELKVLTNHLNVYDDILALFVSNLKTDKRYSQFQRILEYTDDFYDSFVNFYKECDREVKSTQLRDLTVAFKTYILLGSNNHQLKHLPLHNGLFKTQPYRTTYLTDTDTLTTLIARNNTLYLGGYTLQQLLVVVGWKVLFLGDRDYVVFGVNHKKSCMVRYSNLTTEQLTDLFKQLKPVYGFKTLLVVNDSKYSPTPQKLVGQGRSRYSIHIDFNELEI